MLVVSSPSVVAGPVMLEQAETNRLTRRKKPMHLTNPIFEEPRRVSASRNSEKVVLGTLTSDTFRDE
jgi:hypothetical protein